MSSPDQTTEKKDAVATATPVDAPNAPAAPAEKEEHKEPRSGNASEEAKGSESALNEKPAETAEPAAKPEKPVETTEPEAQPEKSDESDKKDEKKDELADVEMKDAAEGAAAEPVPEKKEATADKAKAARRKSTGGSEAKGKKLNKKQSKARLLNLNAQPGDQYLVKLKGFPPWPAIVCDEDMLPGPILVSRPVTAKRADGTYREDFADGGKRANDRTFPVMYLYTNEFGWVPNTSLQELSPEAASAAINDKMRKDLQSAYELASEGHDLDFYKELLQQFQEELVAKEEAQKAKKKRASAVDDMDIDAVDKTPAKKSKKRKAEDEMITPQRSDSVKKPKIKLTGSSAKAAANGAATPKSTGQSASRSSSKAKAKKAADKDETPVPKKPELSEKERHERRVKEVYYLRHKLQKGLFPKEQPIKAEDMPAMAEFFTRLEDFTEMDASILRATRIHKLPKAIIRLETIPREDEFNFKSRSTGLLEKWNKILADAPPAEEAPAGVNGAEEAKDKNVAKTGTNGTEKTQAKVTPAEETETKDEGQNSVEETTEAGREENKTPAAVEASA